MHGSVLKNCDIKEQHANSVPYALFRQTCILKTATRINQSTVCLVLVLPFSIGVPAQVTVRRISHQNGSSINQSNLFRQKTHVCSQNIYNQHMNTLNEVQ